MAASMPTIPGRPLKASGGDVDRRLYRIMLWCYVTVFPLVVMFVVIGVVSNSSAVVVVTVERVISMAVQTFSLYAIHQVLRDDIHEFPYGPGKLEDFAAFLCGVLYVPSGVYLAYDAATRLASPQDVAYALSMIPVAVSAVRMVLLYGAVRRLARQAPLSSPLLRAYVLDFRIGLLGDIGVLCAFALGWLLVHYDLAGGGERVDPVVALAISAYMIWSGASLVRHSFRSLMDMPLPAAQRLRVMTVLAGHHWDYQTVGTLYSRSSGKTRIVEIELVFPAERTLAEIEGLSAAMEEALGEEIPALQFRIIPVTALP